MQQLQQQNKMQKRRTNNQRKATVQITVYVVKQRRPKLHLLSNLNESRRGSYRQLSPLKSPAGAPYDRKAQLLLYSQQLRATATFLRAGSFTPNNNPQPHHHHHHHKHSKQLLQITQTRRHNPNNNKFQLAAAAAAAHPLQITTNAGNPHQEHLDDPTSPWKVVEAEQRSRAATEAKLPPPPPSCFGDWKKLFFPSFCSKDYVGHVKKSRRRKKKTMIASLGRKISAIMMSSRMEKERIGVIAKFLSVIGKHR